MAGEVSEDEGEGLVPVAKDGCKEGKIRDWREEGKGESEYDKEKEG